MMNSRLLPEACYDLEDLSLNDVMIAYETRTTITGFVEKILPDALLVKLGENLFAHLPFSEVTIYPFKYSKNTNRTLPIQICTLLHRKIRIKVTNIEGNKITLSRKQNMICALEHLSKCTFIYFHITSVDRGKCYGDCGDGIIGCVDIRDVSASWLRNMNEYFHKGDKIWVKVLNTDSLGQFILSYKDVFPKYNPYNYKTGDHVIGSISELNAQKDGFFVNITPQIRGIVDISDNMPKLHYGQFVECYVKKPTADGLKLRFIKVMEE